VKRDDHQERQRFADEVTATNLTRLWWFTLTTLAISACTLMFNLFSSQKNAAVIPLQWADQIITLTLIALIWWARKQSAPAQWKSALVIAYTVLMLVFLDGYFFYTVPLVGHNSAYVLGAVACGVLILLPPGLFLPLLLVNHAFYCVMVLTSGKGALFAISAIIDGSTGVVIGGFASFFLYTARWNDFRKERLIAERNRELAASNRQLQERNEEMNELMAIAAHDLRSPLEGQQNLLELARSRPAWKSEQLAEVMDTAIHSCRAMLALVGRLLDAHKAEHGNLPLQPADIRESLHTAIARTKSRADAKGIHLEIIIPDESAIASIHASALEEVLENLLVNAVKFSTSDSTIRVSLFAGDGSWQVEISDEGPGIPENERSSLFRKFHRGTNQPTAGETSTGMGLFIVKKLTETMGGSVEYAPCQPHGSIFRLTFPDKSKTPAGISPDGRLK